MCRSMVDIQSATAEIRRGKKEERKKKERKTTMWADAQRDGRQPNIGGDLCEISVIPFLVPRRKAWLTPAAGVPCSNAANIGERET